MLEVKNLTKEFFMGFKLDDISFKLEPGYIMGFIGPNGSGKSTTIKLIMNLLKKDSGEIKIFGKDHIESEIEIKDRIGFVYDEPYFYEDLTLEKMKNIIAPFYSQWDEKQYERYLKKFDLKPQYVIKRMSKGMVTKFALAIALSHHAQLIIMDEPTSGLDPIFRREILDIIYDLIKDESLSIFFSTHITTDLERIADYITYINKGKLVFSKSKDEIMDNFGLVKGGPEELVSNLRNILLDLRESNVGFTGLTENVNIIKDSYPNLLIERPSLEDIMYATRGDRDVKLD